MRSQFKSSVIRVPLESGLYSKDVMMDQLTFIGSGLTMSMDLEIWKGSTGWDWTISVLRVDLEDVSDTRIYAEYSSFSVDDN